MVLFESRGGQHYERRDHQNRCKEFERRRRFVKNDCKVADARRQTEQSDRDEFHSYNFQDETFDAIEMAGS